jgi:hypothetical protein
MQEDIVKGDTIYCWYDSLDEFAEAAERRHGTDGRASDYSGQDRWAGGSFRQALDYARVGWEAKLDETLAIAESAITMVEKDHTLKAFVPVWDVAGCEVDVARYLSGEPENMIDFPVTEVSKLGKVITLCASISASSAVSVEALTRRGQVLAAFAMLITRLGYSCELWIDQTCGYSYTYSQKVMVKGTNDTVDPSRIVAAFAHPTMLRQLSFSVEDGVPEFWYRKALRTGRGTPKPPVRNLPEGTIYLPELCSDRDVPDADELLKDLLRQADLLVD